MENSARAGCYVHLPFCDRICPYCDFAVVRYAEDRCARYLAALHKEIAMTAPPAAEVTTIFLGGGTPSALRADDLAAVLTAVYDRLSIVPGHVECTLEANPSRGSADLEAWRAAGVTRLSVGVQSFVDEELRRLGRDHTSADAAGFIAAARSAGFASISLDLIAGAPGQTAASFERSLTRALELAPDHVSVYGLTIEHGTPYARWHAREPSAFPTDDDIASMLEHADTRLSGGGYEHYEISNFARPGHRCRHNAGYWRQQDCIAYGMSASGYEAGLRYRNARAFDAYCGAVEAGRSPRAQTERLDAARRIGEAAMLALRTAEGIDDGDFERRFGVDAAAIFADARKKCCAAGLLETDRLGARLTARGRLLANDVCAEFLAPQMGGTASAGYREGAPAS